MTINITDQLRSTQRIVLISTRGNGMPAKNTYSLSFLEASRTELRSTKEIISVLELIGTSIIQAKNYTYSLSFLVRH
jgi:hypothetical protein